MPTVAVVRLRYAAKDYWFDPCGINVEEGDHVLVETARGREIGLAVAPMRDVHENDLSAPLKPVLRIATEADLQQADEMARRSEEAMGPFRDLIEKHELDMKPVRVEYMFSGDFATFYFAAEDRVDFRALVRDLAAQFHIRVDMRQIGVRDEARMLGGLGHCGEELCCRRMGGDFQPVSIRMAKEQDLPLNPSKISGLCGRLMCCLRYEFEAYKDFKGRAPKKNALIDTPAGMAKVVEFDTPREQLRLRLEDGSTMVVPLGSMDTGDKKPKEGERVRPCHIGQDAWDQIIEDLNKDENLAMMGEKLFSSDEALADKVAEATAVERPTRRRRRGSEQAEQQPKERSEQRRGQAKKGQDQEEAPARTPRRRRRSVSVNGDEKPVRAEAAPQPKQQPEKGGQQQSKPSGSGSGNRRRRRRGSGSGQSGQQQGGQQQPKQNQQPKQGGQQPKPRPGQHSSTLSGTKPQGGGNARPQGGSSESDASKPRRRRRRGGRGRGGSGNGQGSSGNE